MNHEESILEFLLFKIKKLEEEKSFLKKRIDRIIEIVVLSEEWRKDSEITFSEKDGELIVDISRRIT